MRKQLINCKPLGIKHMLLLSEVDFIIDSHVFVVAVVLYVASADFCQVLMILLRLEGQCIYLQSLVESSLTLLTNVILCCDFRSHGCTYVLVC